MPRAVESLLTYIVNHRLLPAEEKHNELTTRLPFDTTTEDDAGNIVAENTPNALEQEQTLLSDNLPIFADALAAAASIRNVGTGELALKDTNSLHNTMADVLVRYLVRTDLASVRSEEDTAAPTSSADPEMEAHGLPVEQVHPYTYYFTINWGLLAACAEAAGTNLDAVLADVQNGSLA